MFFIRKRPQHLNHCNFHQFVVLVELFTQNGEKIDPHQQIGNWIQVLTFIHYPLSIMGHCELET